METIRRNKTLRMVQLALFIAIIVLMAFTPIGYIKTLGFEITLIVIPVTVGAIILGPGAGALLGGVFGITSFIQCFGMSAPGAALLAINPIGTFILCLIPRILMGWLTGICFVGLKKIDKTRGISYAVTSLVGPILNTIFFVATLIIIFYSADFVNAFKANNVYTYLVGFVGINGLVEAGISFVLGTAVSKTVDVVVERTSVKQ